jgi:hypothetical protein
MRPLTVVMLLHVVASGVTAQARNTRALPPETYASAAIDADGDLVIVTANGQTVIVRKAGDQAAFSVPVVSSAGTAVGAQAMFRNCCTSYDIPLQLVVYAGGKEHRFKGIDLPIFRWGFSGGTRVAYGQEPVHFGCATHYELRDIESERLIESVEVPQSCEQMPEPKPVNLPRWVIDLVAKK